MDLKKLAAEKAVEFVQDNMVVGLGTGTTAYWAIKKIGERVKDGLRIHAVCTSAATEKLAAEAGIPMLPFSAVATIDISIDGADEVDQQHNLIKGGGGALLREKIIAFNSQKFLVIVDESKLVANLGRFPLPVEILPFAAELTLQHLQKKGSVKIRQKDGAPFLTDNGNLIADVALFPIADPAALDAELRRIPGVLETGLFLNAIVQSVIVGQRSGEVSILSW